VTDSDQLVEYPIAPAVPPAELPLVEGLLVGGLREVRVIW
jgi:hypothetical protein